MPRPRHLLLMTLLASTTALSGQAWAATPLGDDYPEVGGWGQAWGEDTPPSPPPVQTQARQRPVAPLAPDISPLPAAATPRIASPSTSAGAPRGTAQPLDEGGQSYPEVGGWGQAWGDEALVPAAPPRRTADPTATATAPDAKPAATTSAPPAKTVAPPTNQVRGSGSPAPAASEGRRATTLIIEQDEAGDATGLRRPPRLIPKPVQGLNLRQEGDHPAVHMEADQVIYDRTYNIVTAKGRVVMIQSNRTITADTVTYNLKQDVMGASGNVILTEPSGEVTQADYLELTGDFKTGVASNLRMILADDSRLSAESAQRVGGDRTDLDYGTYTACEPCREDPNWTPLWEAKAIRITHNQAEAQVEYRDAWVEFLGVPIMYTPYLSHPDPTVKRKSGFLTPGFGYSSNNGASVTTPYFFVLSESEDLTLSPRFTLSAGENPINGENVDSLGTKAMQRVLLQGEHRWRGTYGESKTQASITADQDTGTTRGHVDSKGMVELDRTWRAGWLAQYQSDETYRTVYHIRAENDRPWRIVRPYVEGFGRRNYVMAEAMSFQGHRLESDTQHSPVVLPHVVSRQISDVGWGGSYWTMDSDMLAYTRSSGTIAQRLSHEAGWHLPMATPGGQLLTLSTSMRGDAYHATGMTNRSGDTTAERAIPQIALQWRYPLLQSGAGFSQVIEPIAMLAMSPNSGNNGRVPNEDSLTFELDETNVMRPNRLSGLDRVDGGLRGGYGLRWAAYPLRGGQVAAQVAQGWQRHVNTNFAPGSGFTDTLSDYLGRVDVTPAGFFTVTDRIRIDKDSLNLRRNEATISVGPSALALSLSYGYLSSSGSSSSQVYPRRHYVNYSVNSTLSQYWRAWGSMSQDLADKGGTLTWSANTAYSDECFSLIASLNRYNTTVEGLMSGYSATLTFSLKSLGEAPVGLF